MSGLDATGGVRRAHARLHRAKRVFDGLATLAHSQRISIKALLHSVEQMLVLPSGDPSL
jgi:hypothetical protein